jgi:hypothetical protein
VGAHKHSITQFTSSSGGGPDGSAPIDRLLEQRASVVLPGVGGNDGAAVAHVEQLEEDRVQGMRKQSVLRALGERSKSITYTSTRDGSRSTVKHTRRNLSVDAAAAAAGADDDAFERDWSAASPALLAVSPAGASFAGLRSPASVHASVNYMHEMQQFPSPLASTSSPMRRSVERRTHNRSFHVDAHGHVQETTVLPSVVGVSATTTPLRSPVRSPGGSTGAAAAARQSPKATHVSLPSQQQQRKAARSAPASGNGGMKAKLRQ